MTSTVSTKFSSNYVPYGNNYVASGKEVFMYTGKPYDSADGLYYYGARFYDSNTGRFVTQDTNTGLISDPISLNLYIYSRDNPMKYIDPDGHIAYVATSDARKQPTPYQQALATTLGVDIVAGGAVAVKRWWSLSLG
jgi:RHS repeat-associated protein